MTEYSPLRDFLLRSSATTVTLRLTQIEEILGAALPASARKYREFWNNGLRNGGGHSASWLKIGWKTSGVDLADEIITFTKTGAPAPRSVSRISVTGVSVRNLWRGLGHVTIGRDGSLMFPEMLAVPGLYRINLSGVGRARCYIGETVDLRKRFAHYRRPGPTQTTNIRMNELMRQHLSEGGSVSVETVTGITRVNLGSGATAVDLKDKAVRRMFEQTAIVESGATDVESLNR